MASPVEKAEVPEEEINELGSGPRGSATAMSISQMRRSQSKSSWYLDSFKGYEPGSEGRKITPFKPEGKSEPSSALLERLPDIHKKNSSFLPPINPKSSSMTGRPGPLRPQKTDPFSSYTHGSLSGGSGYDPLLLDKIPGIDIDESPGDKGLSISQQRRKKPPLYNVG